MPDETSSVPELHSKLDVLLAKIAGSQRKVWVDYVCAFVLAATTVASAWCAYQSARWSGVQTFRLAKSNKASRDAGVHLSNAMLMTSFDAQMFIAMMEARNRGDDKQMAFLRERFRPETRPAVEAWLALEAANKPDSPKHPFLMPEYVLNDREESHRLTAESERIFDTAYDANATSDRYTLLTVLFATVLFFAGISSTVHLIFLRRILLVLAGLLFVATLISLSGLPYCRE
ncbi:hypothetical protein BH11PLA2_BH11PLA2_22060 [soil metagenome]